MENFTSVHEETVESLKNVHGSQCMPALPRVHTNKMEEIEEIWILGTSKDMQDTI